MLHNILASQRLETKSDDDISGVVSISEEDSQPIVVRDEKLSTAYIYSATGIGSLVSGEVESSYEVSRESTINLDNTTLIVSGNIEISRKLEICYRNQDEKVWDNSNIVSANHFRTFIFDDNISSYLPSSVSSEQFKNIKDLIRRCFNKLRNAHIESLYNAVRIRDYSFMGVTDLVARDALETINKVFFNKFITLNNGDITNYVDHYLGLQCGDVATKDITPIRKLIWNNAKSFTSDKQDIYIHGKSVSISESLWNHSGAITIVAGADMVIDDGLYIQDGDILNHDLMIEAKDDTVQLGPATHHKS